MKSNVLVLIDRRVGKGDQGSSPPKWLGAICYRGGNLGSFEFLGAYSPPLPPSPEIYCKREMENWHWRPPWHFCHNPKFFPGYTPNVVHVYSVLVSRPMDQRSVRLQHEQYLQPDSPSHRKKSYPNIVRGHKVKNIT